MKFFDRVICLSLAICLVFAVFSVNAVAAETTSITAQNVTGTAGDTVDVKITLTDNVGFAYLNITIAYDTDNLELVSATDGELFDGIFTASETLMTEPYVISWLAADGDNTSANGDIATLTFKIKASAAAGDYDIDITVDQCFNSMLNAVTVNAVDGKITAEGASFIRGDLDSDGTVTSDDAIYLLYYSLLPDLYPVDQDVDFDKDGDVTSDDAIYLLYHSLLPDLYPIE